LASTSFSSDAVVLTNSRVSSRTTFRSAGRSRCPLCSVRRLHSIQSKSSCHTRRTKGMSCFHLGMWWNGDYNIRFCTQWISAVTSKLFGSNRNGLEITYSFIT